MTRQLKIVDGNYHARPEIKYIGRIKGTHEMYGMDVRFFPKSRNIISIPDDLKKDEIVQIKVQKSDQAKAKRLHFRVTEIDEDKISLETVDYMEAVDYAETLEYDKAHSQLEHFDEDDIVEYVKIQLQEENPFYTAHFQLLKEDESANDDFKDMLDEIDEEDESAEFFDDDVCEHISTEK